MRHAAHFAEQPMRPAQCAVGAAESATVQPVASQRKAPVLQAISELYVLCDALVGWLTRCAKGEQPDCSWRAHMLRALQQPPTVIAGACGCAVQAPALFPSAVADSSSFDSRCMELLTAVVRTALSECYLPQTAESRTPHPRV
jgi:hypothetical protein